MKWIMVIVFIWGGRPAMERVEGFADRRDCVLASHEMRVSLRAQMSGTISNGAQILTYCVRVGR